VAGNGNAQRPEHHSPATLANDERQASGQRLAVEILCGDAIHHSARRSTLRNFFERGESFQIKSFGSYSGTAKRMRRAARSSSVFARAIWYGNDALEQRLVAHHDTLLGKERRGERGHLAIGIALICSRSANPTSPR